MKAGKKPMVIAVSAALLSLAAPSFAQQSTAQDSAVQAQSEMAVVAVTGIRASMQKSLDTKKNSGASVEVVTAEDIGKMPDKNIADSLQRLPGVTISSPAPAEGGFDENRPRLACAAPTPSLTQTTAQRPLRRLRRLVRADQTSSRPQRQLHAAAVGTGQPGHRAQERRRPTSSKAALSARSTSSRASRSTSRSSSPSKRRSARSTPTCRRRPTRNSARWSTGRTTADTFGVMVQGFSEKRAIRRDSPGAPRLAHHRADQHAGQGAP